MPSSYPTDPILLAAQARAVLDKLHKQGDVVVRFKTDHSGFDEDSLDDIDRAAPGHFKTDKNVLALNLDALIKPEKPAPRSLESVEDFRQFPVLAGVAAHECGHARWSLWGAPEHRIDSLPNPDHDPEDPESGPEVFSVSETGKLMAFAQVLEEPRIERLGVNTYTKTWRRAMQFSAGHLILEQVEEMDSNDEKPLESAVKLAILVGGRATAGTLGTTYESRQSVKKVLESAQAIIEKAVGEEIEDPYHKIMGIINAEVFNNDHESPTSHLEAARQILKIVRPEEADDPDAGQQGGGDGEGEEGEGDGGGAAAGMLKGLMDEMREAVDGMSEALSEMVISEEEQPDSEKNEEYGGHGSTIYKNPKAPQVNRHEQPTAEDRELYRRALSWMEQQIEPTVTETEQGQWLPGSGARLNLRGYIRDNLADHKASQRSDWDRVSETVKPAPPVKVAIMLDGSGSMGHMARPSASIAWAAANAAAQLPESRTVSVVYGAAAQVTQAPGRLPARTVAVSNTDGPTEAFIEAAEMVEEALWLDEPIEEGERSNVLIIIVSDLYYGGRGPRGESQMAGFGRIVRDWADRGYKIVVVGTNEQQANNAMASYGGPALSSSAIRDEVRKAFTIAKPEELFR